MKTSILKILVNTRCKVSLFHYLPVVLYAGFIFYLSSLSSVSLPHFKISDKLAHLILYSVLGFLFVRAFYPSVYRWNRGRIILVAVFGCLAYGIVDEFHQSFVPSRSADILDIVMDVLGGLMGGLAFLFERYVSNHPVN